ncbi:ketodeoxygluconokinase [Saccharobesus litoralis]|uniref:2-dehydro-3-deoxygluconokinase n=1 Tax=Saccharobesus litoralis TaxID=2172099 RepID=A0A2S0VL65_9ALTE|nr:sugar kinase [Saccharobesus litoralis]AWB64948.1 ketodeoxygluconokinase [Saccharobesus litoralis]
MSNSGNPTFRIAFVGECMIELQEDAQGVIHKGFAGDTLNTALYMARLSYLHNAEVQYVTGLGLDSFSQAMIENWQSEGIACDYIRRFENKLPGLYFVEVDEDGERSFQYWRGQAAARDLFSGSEFDKQLNEIAEFDYIYLSGISLAILPEEGKQRLVDWLNQSRANGAKVCFDNNYRPKLWANKQETQKWYSKVLQATDIACHTFDDDQLIWGDTEPSQAFERLQGFGVSEIILKRGTEPCLIEIDGGVTQSIPAIKVAKENLADTNAAGDSFSAGYLSARLAGQAPAESAAIAHRVASTVVQHRGAIIPRDVMPKIEL